MCGFGAAMIGLSVVGLGMSVYGQYQQGKAAQAQADYQAKVNENNAKIAEMQAADIEQKGLEDRTTLQEQYAAAKAEGRTGFAASNVMLGQGSAAEWEKSVSRAQAEDQSTLDYNTAVDAWAMRNQASDLRANAAASRASGRSAYTGSLISAGATLLSGAAQTGYQAYSIRS